MGLLLLAPSPCPNSYGQYLYTSHTLAGPPSGTNKITLLLTISPNEPASVKTLKQLVNYRMTLFEPTQRCVVEEVVSVLVDLGGAFGVYDDYVMRMRFYAYCVVKQNFAHAHVIE